MSGDDVPILQLLISTKNVIHYVKTAFLSIIFSSQGTVTVILHLI